MVSFKRLLPRFSLRTLVIFLLLVTSGVGLAYSYRLWVKCLTIRLAPDWRRNARMSRDGTRIVTFGISSKARVWSAENGECLHVLSGHNGLVNHAEFSRDGSMIVTSGEDGKAIVWDAATGRRVQTFDVGSFYWAALSPSGKSVLTSPFALWSVETGKVITGFPPGTLCWFPAEGDHVVCRQPDSGVWSLYDAATGERLGIVRREEFGGPPVLRDPTTQEVIQSMSTLEVLQAALANGMELEDALGGEDAADRALAALPGQYLGHSVRPDDLVILVGSAEGVTVMRYRPPRGRWGLGARVEFWLTVVFAGLFVWSAVRDRRRLARTG